MTVAATAPARTARTEVPLHPLLAERWSPRAFDPTREVTDAQLTAVLEAARWSPSAGNSQPWRFLVTRRGEAAFDRLLGVLNAGNQVWAGNAGVLLLAVAAVSGPDGGERSHARYDLGQAVAHLTVQAHAEGLVVHQMAGFDPAAARDGFALPAGLVPTTVVALGAHAPHVELAEPYATRERAERGRLPLSDLILPAALPAVG